ncbi:tetratricopeptide repeat protein [Dyadobacter sediminis]|uniref:Tetratricopeptide repeat protein n=1 Tax=Dyadobacter sediminis TaxID=1493691 RepID=A0A5R9KJ49_9BACT|nr:tetratricopeptide repeat protein [Dyadobacter sediminis]TLU96235.1 tetratricopeptide repeat protein [Dyadobacter sediminis]
MSIRLELIVILILLVLNILSCTSQSKKDAADFFLKGNQALNQKNYAEAVRFYNEAIAKNADFSDAYLNKGISLLKMNKAEEAFDVLSEAIRIDPTLVQANLVRAETSLHLGRLREVRQDLQAIEKQYRDSTRYYLIKGDLLSAEGNSALAIPEYDKAVQLKSSNVEALVNRGAIYYNMHAYKQAKADFNAAVSISPLLPQALNNLGLIATKEKNWPLALAYFDKVLDADPSDPYSLNNKGYVLLQTGQAEKGKELISRSLEKLPENGYALRNLGMYYQLTGNIDLAVETYKKAIDLSEPVDMLYGLAGSAYWQQKNASEACRIWKQGIILKDSASIAEAAKNCK